MSRQSPFPLSSLAVGALLLAACAPTEQQTALAAPPPNAFDEAAWRAPTEVDIPNDSLGASIRRGLALLRFTPESLPRFAPSSLRCTSCHQNDGLKASAAPLTGSHARYPKYMPRTGAVIGLADRVNYCFTRSLAGNAVPTESREMQDILAYLAFISRGIPVGTKIQGADGLIAMAEPLVGDTARGRAMFQQECVVCHMPDGQGNGPIPALWGPRSYSIGASMAREERAASFIYHNMPQTKPGSLTTQQAFDLAAFVNSHPRPDSPGKEKDFPLGGAPKDTPYRTAQGEAYRPPKLLPRKNPSGAIVPPPAPIARRAK
ncbi:MAG: c-type cytochrome [Gemmatimonadota bacterium]